PGAADRRRRLAPDLVEAIDPPAPAMEDRRAGRMPGRPPPREDVEEPAAEREKERRAVLRDRALQAQFAADEALTLEDGIHHRPHEAEDVGAAQAREVGALDDVGDDRIPGAELAEEHVEVGRMQKPLAGGGPR